MLATAWPFITLDDRGRPRIGEARQQVLLLVEEHLSYGWTAEQIARQHPHLTLPQIHAALGYYFEHQADCDRMREEDEREIGQLRMQLEDPDLQARLRRLKEGA